MKAIQLKKITLVQTITTMFLSGKVLSQDDIVQVARVVMTDLEIGFKEALEFVSEVLTMISQAQDSLSA